MQPDAIRTQAARASLGAIRTAHWSSPSARKAGLSRGTSGTHADGKAARQRRTATAASSAITIPRLRDRDGG